LTVVGDLRKTGLDDGTISFPHTSEGRRVYSQIHARALMVCRVLCYLGFIWGFCDALIMVEWYYMITGNGFGRYMFVEGMWVFLRGIWAGSMTHCDYEGPCRQDTGLPLRRAGGVEVG